MLGLGSMKYKFVYLGLLCLFLFAGESALHGQTARDWVGGTGDWFDVNNWDTGVPNANDPTFISNGGTAVVANAGASANYLNVGGGGILINGGGALSSNIAFFGGGASATVDGLSSSWTNANGLYLGSGGNGNSSLNIQNAASLASYNVFLGDTASCTGVVNVSGKNSTLSARNDLFVGNDGAGSLSVGSGATVSSLNTFIATKGSGTMTVNGAGSGLFNSGNLYIAGDSAAGHVGGSLTVSRGATASNGSTFVATQGALTVCGVGSSFNDAGNLYLGDSSAGGLVKVSSGAALTSTNAYVNPGASLTVGGVGSGVTLTGNFYQDGLTSVLNGGHLVVQNTAHVSGTLSVAGANSNMSFGGLTTATNSTLQFTLGSPVSAGSYNGGVITVGSQGASISQGTSLSFADAPKTSGNYRLIGGNISGIAASSFNITNQPVGYQYSLSSTVDPGYLDLVAMPVPPPQKIILDFADRAPFQVLTYNGAIIPLQHNDIDYSSLSPTASKLTVADQSAILAGVRNVFDSSGVTNVDIEIGHAQPGAKVVYFSDRTTNPAWGGYSIAGLNRFNADPNGSSIVYSNTNYWEADDAGQNAVAFGRLLDINTAVHEIGHTLGLRHVDPAPQTDSLDNTTYEVMRKDPYITVAALQSLRFLNAVSTVQGSNIGDYVTHNPQYYLQHYIDGVPDETLKSAGILPGTYDDPAHSTTLIKVLLGTGDNSGLTIYNVSMIENAGQDDSSVIGQFGQITLGELASQSFQIATGDTLSFVGSAAPGSESDITIAVGDPHTIDNLLFGSSQTMSADFDLVTASGFSVLAGVTVTSNVVPEPRRIVPLASILVLAFACLRRRVQHEVL